MSKRGHEQFIDDRLDDLAEEYYGKTVDSEDKYQKDTKFREWCDREYENHVASAEDAQFDSYKDSQV